MSDHYVRFNDACFTDNTNYTMSYVSKFQGFKGFINSTQAPSATWANKYTYTNTNIHKYMQ